MGIFSGLFGGGRKQVDLWKRFERLRESNSGTMSAFYKVRDRQDGEVRGLKIIDREKIAPIEGRYKGLGKPGEGEIGKQITGPNIVRTLEWGESTTGEPFVLQEFVEGSLLHALLTVKKIALSPTQKLDLVRAFKDSGEIVAVTGDGVNDVPALQAADIGIAMGERGTRSAREVAAIVLLDDDIGRDVVVI
jgi:hypothetical protein